MTKEEFSEKHKHEMYGWVLDVATAHKSGAELSLLLRSIQVKIRARLDEMYADLTKPEPPRTADAAKNGAPVAQRGRV